MNLLRIEGISKRILFFEKDRILPKLKEKFCLGLDVHSMTLLHWHCEYCMADTAAYFECIVWESKRRDEIELIQRNEDWPERM